MALSPRQIAELVRRYNHGAGDSVGDLAAAFDMNAAAVRYQLKKANVYASLLSPESEAGETVGPTDAELGIGEDDQATGADDAPEALGELLKNPAFAALIDKAVAARIAQMGDAPAGPAIPQDSNVAMVKAIEHLLDVQSAQMPGYIKPVSAEEVDRRAAGLVECRALIAAARERYNTTGDKSVVPHYMLGQNLFDSTEAIQYEEGSEIRTFLEPPESAIPLNETARKIHAAMITSIGGPSPDIGARVAEAMLDAKGKDVPIIGGTAARAGVNRVEVVPQSKRHDVRPQRVLGTLTPETRGTSMPMQPGVTAQPSGPVFVGA